MGGRSQRDHRPKISAGASARQLLVSCRGRCCTSQSSTSHPGSRSGPRRRTSRIDSYRYRTRTARRSSRLPFDLGSSADPDRRTARTCCCRSANRRTCSPRRRRSTSGRSSRRRRPDSRRPSTCLGSHRSSRPPARRASCRCCSSHRRCTRCRRSKVGQGRRKPSTCPCSDCRYCLPRCRSPLARSDRGNSCRQAHRKRDWSGPRTSTILRCRYQAARRTWWPSCGRFRRCSRSPPSHNRQPRNTVDPCRHTPQRRRSSKAGRWRCSAQMPRTSCSRSTRRSRRCRPDSNPAQARRSSCTSRPCRRRRASTSARRRCRVCCWDRSIRPRRTSRPHSTAGRGRHIAGTRCCYRTRVRRQCRRRRDSTADPRRHTACMCCSRTRAQNRTCGVRCRSTARNTVGPPRRK